MIERHWKTKHPSWAFNKSKFSPISVQSQSSLFRLGFSPKIPADDVKQPDAEDSSVSDTIDDEEDVMESGDKREVEDADDSYRDWLYRAYFIVLLYQH